MYYTKKSLPRVKRPSKAEQREQWLRDSAAIQGITLEEMKRTAAASPSRTDKEA